MNWGHVEVLLKQLIEGGVVSVRSVSLNRPSLFGNKTVTTRCYRAAADTVSKLLKLNPKEANPDSPTFFDDLRLDDQLRLKIAAFVNSVPFNIVFILLFS